MSSYVKRCAGRWCDRRVLGISSFRVLAKGVRSDLCRVCEGHERREATELRRAQRLSDLLRYEHNLQNQLSRLRRRIRRMQSVDMVA